LAQSIFHINICDAALSSLVSCLWASYPPLHLQLELLLNVEACYTLRKWHQINSSSFALSCISYFFQYEWPFTFLGAMYFADQFFIHYASSPA